MSILVITVQYLKYNYLCLFLCILHHSLSVPAFVLSLVMMNC